MMAAEEADFPLVALEEELTCCICLSPFDCPVTIPCGHNFCQDCLLATWEDANFSCPQCRTSFPSRPELQKNTVLSSVVEAFKLKSSKKSSAIPTEQESKAEEQSKAEEKHVVLCDACMEAEASKTCLTCMASYCEEHLRPHRDNPTFRVHQLIDPVGDLSEHICSEHHKLMEHFCTEHGRLICSSCLQQVHKSCSFSSPEEQRGLKENDFRAKLSLLNEKIERTDSVVLQINDLQNKLKGAANSRKTALSAAYQQLRDMLAQDERAALHEVDCELEKGQMKLQHFAKRFSENNEKMRTAREDINDLLRRSQTTAFLQASFELPKVIKFDPYAPRINLDSERVTAAQSFAADLKGSLMEILSQPFEARPPLLGSGDAETSGSESEPESTGDEPLTNSAPERPQQEGGHPGLNHPAPPAVHTIYQQVPFPIYMQPRPSWNNAQHNRFGPSSFSTGRQNPHGEKFKKPSGKKNKSTSNPAPKAHQNSGGDRSQPPKNKEPGTPIQTSLPKPASKKRSKGTKSSDASGLTKRELSKSMEHLLDVKVNKLKEKISVLNAEIAKDIASAEKRSELMKFGVGFTFDPRTAHKRIILTEDFTKASVSDETTNYPECPERFALCSQVLSSRGFIRGRHYWEFRLSCNNFIGVGLAYGSLDRKGPASRLGRNNMSWCLEWFNVKLSAWHNSVEVVLVNPSPKRVGVLLDCEEGRATFYNVADRAYPLHSFSIPCVEAVYPAVWAFSSGSSVTLCKLQ